MASIITVPNVNESAMNKERERIARWAPGHGWVYTGYNDEGDHVAQISRAAGGAAITILDFSCHGSPGSFDHTSSSTAPQFGRSLAQLLGFGAGTPIYLSACNTGLTSRFRTVPIAQTLADGTRCTVYGTKGYMTGTYAEGNEQCYAGPDVPPPEGPLEPYPGAQTASGRDVWVPFHPPGLRAPDLAGLHGMTVGVDPHGRVWATFDPAALREVQAMEATSITIHTQARATRGLENLLENTMGTSPVPFPELRMAPDITINYVGEEGVLILDVYANGGLVRNRVTGRTWRVQEPDVLAAQVRQHLGR
jgi:hypothetical protein